MVTNVFVVSRCWVKVNVISVTKGAPVARMRCIFSPTPPLFCSLQPHIVLGLLVYSRSRHDDSGGVYMKTFRTVYRPVFRDGDFISLLNLIDVAIRDLLNRTRTCCQRHNRSG